MLVARDEAAAVRAPPNGLAFSCRERAGSSLQKANDLAREAVSCNAGLGRGRNHFLVRYHDSFHIPLIAHLRRHWDVGVNGGFSGVVRTRWSASSICARIGTGSPEVGGGTFSHMMRK